MIDTLQLSKDLAKSFSLEQAEALASAFAKGNDQFITKDDLAKAIDSLRHEMWEHKAELKTMIAQVEATLRNEIEDSRADLIRWIVGAPLINFFGVAGLMVTLIKVIH